MQAAAAHTIEQQRLNTEVSSLREDKARLQRQAERAPGLKEQLQATSLAITQASQVATYTLFLATACDLPFESLLLFFYCLFFSGVQSADSATLYCPSVSINRANDNGLLWPVHCAQALHLE
jgi:hypothetical protein